MQETLRTVLADGTSIGVEDRIASVDEILAATGMPEVAIADRRFAALVDELGSSDRRRSAEATQ